MNKRDNDVSMVPMLLRLIVGAGFMVHGYAKISRGTGGFEKLLTQTGMPFAHLNAILVPYIELLGGACILMGLGIGMVAVPLILIMLLAMLAIQMRYGFSSVNTTGLTPEGPVFGPPGYEINLLYIACLVSLMITGGGRYSVDYLVGKRRRPGNKRIVKK